MAYGRTLDETATWAVAIVCLVMVGISILIEHLLHMAEKWFKNNHKDALAEALEKLKAELMLMGCISLLLTAFKDPISRICVPKSVADSWHPCRNVKKKDDPYASIDKCSKDGKFAFVSVYGVDQIHYLIFVLAVVHVFYCIMTYLLGRLKMREWMTWEDETKTFEYQYHNDQQRFRFARDTSFGRRHLKLWNKPKIVVWIVCFFRQFFGSVTKVDYLTLRHGFIMAHFAPGSEIKFDFQKYINRSVEEDFTVVVGITPVIWCIACVLMLTSTYGSYEYFWLPFIPLVIILAIGAKLEYIIAQMGIKIQERGDIVQGAPQVQPGDELFWFGSPRLLRFLIHLCLFQNAFQIAFFFFTLWKLPYSCYHKETADVVIKMTMGVVIQIICSYVTLPLYALVTQMGSSMRLSIFQEETAETIKHWHHTAKEHTKHGKHSVSHTPMSSRPGTPTRDMSPVHLLPKNHKSSSAPESVRTSPRNSDADSDNFYTESLKPAPDHQAIEIEQIDTPIEVTEKNVETEQEHGPNTALLAQASGTVSARHEIGPASREFSFRKAMSTLSRSNLK